MTTPKTWRLLTIEVPAEEADTAVALLAELGSTGAREEETAAGNRRLIAAFPADDRSEEALSAAVRDAFAPFPLLSDATLAFSVEEERDWHEQFRERFRPFTFIPGVTIVPSWANSDAPPGDMVISMDPGMAFGTGLHETTRLCGTALQTASAACATDHRSLLDVGTGSGVLAIMGCKLGMRPVVGVEHDPDALPVARENCDKNGCPEITLLASVSEVRGHFAVVVANILLGTLLELRQDLTRLTAPRGQLLLSGILHEQERDLLEAYAPDFEYSQTSRRGEWSCLLLAKTRDS